ncbi:glycosyltransferase family protein [Thalassoglobus neptunius]|nr:glycosyltransferase [Thalassoglobus neptunius]
MDVIDRNVICMKWGRKYDATYVNKLHSMVSRHLTLPHRFICFTDNDEGFHPDIEVLPMPEQDLTKGTKTGAWNKVYNFRKELGDLRGQALFLDLDVIILQNIDSFFEIPGSFCVIREWDKSSQGTGNTSVYRFDIGAHVHVYENLIEHKAEICGKYRREQAYVTESIAEHGDITYWPENWCRSFKRHCLPRWPLSWIQPPTIPDDAKILIFHGDPKPEDAIRGSRSKLRRIQATPALAEHWR